MSMGKQICYHNIRENIKRMHPRLKELAIQAGAVPDNGTIITSSMDDSKFAELIVQECIKVAGTEMGYSEYVAMRSKIEKHFGVDRKSTRLNSSHT